MVLFQKSFITSTQDILIFKSWCIHVEHTFRHSMMQKLLVRIALVQREGAVNERVSEKI